MTAARDLTPYCAAAACDLNLAGWPHLPWDCDAPLLAPTLDAATVARLPAWRRPWVQGSARTFARLNPTLAGRTPEPGEELPGELACDPYQRQRLREQEATATLGERAEAGLRAENAPPDPACRRVVIAERAEFARLHELDRDLLLDAVTRLRQTPRTCRGGRRWTPGSRYSCSAITRPRSPNAAAGAPPTWTTPPASGSGCWAGWASWTRSRPGSVTRSMMGCAAWR